MIYDAITYLFYALMAVAFIQPNAPRLFAAALFVSITLTHELFLSDLDGLMYYGSAALFDLAIIVLTSGINPVPRMVLSLHRVCIASIIINLVGWALWFFYFPPLFYDLSFVALYAWALWVFIRRDRADVGGYSLASWASCFRFDRSPWLSYLNKYKGEI